MPYFTRSDQTLIRNYGQCPKRTGGLVERHIGVKGGKQMCLDIQGLDERTLAKGEHNGVEWHIVHNDMAYRCGYAKVTPDHPWFGKGYDDIPAEAHGGLTFADYGKACPTHGEKDEWWIGFDCAHCGDAPDPSLPNYRSYGQFSPHDTIKTTEYVKAECLQLCDQIVAAR